MKKLGIIISTMIIILSCSCVTTYAFTEEEATLVVQVTGIMNGDENENMNLDKNVTRAEFTKMLICASQYKDSVPEKSYYSPFGDVPYTNWESGYVQLAVEKGWVNGYTDGTFRPNNTIKLEEAVSIMLKILGYTTEDFVGTYPYAQLSLYNSLNLGEGVSATQGSLLTRRDCMYMLCNMLSAKTKQGQIYLTTLGYIQDTNGHVNIYKLISENIEGPYIVSTTIYDLGLNLSNSEVERNDKEATINDIQKYDVVYYSDRLNKIWAYSKAVSGTYQSVSPSTTNPSSINLSGASYNLETDEASYSVSANGNFHAGDSITALIGREGIVKIMDSKEYNLIIYGLVSGTSIEEYTDSLGNEYSTKVTSINAIDGNTYKVPNEKWTYDVGTLVKVSYGATKPSISKISRKTLSGKVSKTKIGDYKIASDITIVDINDTTMKKIYLSRILDSTITASDVIYYTLNANGEINNLMLDDFTGDLYTYALLLEANNNDQGAHSSGTYKYQVGNKQSTITTSNVTFNISQGPVKMNLSGNVLTGMTKLTEITNIKDITGINLSTSSKTYSIADDIEVYLLEKSEYYTLSLNDIIQKQDEYSIKAYIDNSTSSVGRVRIIIAR